MPLLNVTLVPAPDQVVVRVSGEADLSTAPLVADALWQAAGLGTRQVVVDVAGVRFWDCSGLHALSAFTAELRAAGRSCRIVGAPAPTRRLIAVAALTDRLDLDGPVCRGSAGTAPAEEAPEPNWVADPAHRRPGAHAAPLNPQRPAPALTVRRRS